MIDDTLYTMALSQVRLTFKQKVTLLNTIGSAKAVYEQRYHLQDFGLEVSKKVGDVLQEMEGFLPHCEEELRYAEQHHIQVLTYTDEEHYPLRLRSCEDAPLVLYYLGNANLNAQHIVSIVGTRHATTRGQEWCETFCNDLEHLLPDTLIISGLAYGIDIAAHRAALDHHLSTIGVLAHGLDEIYPRLHRNTAVAMTQQGGLLTEFTSHTTIDKLNFVQRNRIVAGLADATIVVESATKGGSLITAALANDYQRNIFAVPGRTTDTHSEGCNKLIRNNGASLITCAEDLLLDMGWKAQDASTPVQQELFATYAPEEQAIIQALETADGEASLDTLVQQTGLPSALLMSTLLSMEIKGIIKTLPGMKYHLR